jgi:hypothetical protein
VRFYGQESPRKPTCTETAFFFRFPNTTYRRINLCFVYKKLEYFSNLQYLARAPFSYCGLTWMDYVGGSNSCLTWCQQDSYPTLLRGSIGEALSLPSEGGDTEQMEETVKIYWSFRLGVQYRRAERLSLGSWAIMSLSALSRQNVSPAALLPAGP